MLIIKEGGVQWVQYLILIFYLLPNRGGKYFVPLIYLVNK